MKFKLVYSSPRSDSDLDRFHRLNPLIRFSRKTNWTLEDAKQVERILDRRAYELGEYDPAYLIRLGLSTNFMEELQAEVTRYLSILDREPFPTPHQMRQIDLRPVREARNLRHWQRLIDTRCARERVIRLTMPERKTFAARIKAEQKYITNDGIIQLVEQLKARLEKIDPGVSQRAYRVRAVQRPEVPLSMSRHLNLF